MTLFRAVPTARPVAVLIGVLLVAANLRAALAGYPPLLDSVREDLGVSAGVAGLVQAVAVVMMGVGSFAGPRMAGRSGRERAAVWAVAILTAGSLLRAVPALAALVAGSVLVGLGIGLAGVLITGVVKDHLGERAGAVTGGYVVAMMIGATVASAVAVPLAIGLGGWSLSLAFWAIPSALAAAVWWPIARRTPRPSAAERPAPLPWRDPFARLAAAYMATSSIQFYGVLTWLAPYYESLGWERQRAALVLAVWSLVQIPAALLVPAIAERRRRWTFWAGTTLALGASGTIGAILWPNLPVLGGWFWAGLMAIGVGAGFPLGLAVIAWRTPDGSASAAASGLALGFGYVTTGFAPLLMGLLLDLTGHYSVALGVLLVAAACQALAIRKIGNGARAESPAR